MQVSRYNRENTGLFTDISNRLSYRQDTLLSYITQPFSKEAFENQINLKSGYFTAQKRTVLTDVLKEKYNTVTTDEKVTRNIELLSAEKTFTITTGHQLSIFTGPIYFIYKILHVIRLAEELKTLYPSCDFIPVFWMASEDHDFEEIKSVTLFNKTINWETDQQGAVGRFEMESFGDILDEFKQLFANHPESEVLNLLENYKGKSLSEATFQLVNALFQSHGLVIIDGDNKTLKAEFSTIVQEELNNRFSFEAVSKISEKLQAEGVKLQITPREINLFYLDKGLRSRIELHENGFFIQGKGIFTKDELLTELQNNPAAFSPNVVLRPLYQEIILPNLCYLGGGGEMAYWLQLKGVFDYAKCPFPLIQVRNSILLVDNGSSKKIEKLGLTVEQLFQETEDLKKNYVLTHSNDELNFEKLNRSFEQLSATLSEQVLAIDPNLKGFIEAEITRIEKQIITVKQKLIKTEKSKHEQSLTQIEQVKNKLFPNGGMQERSINFFSLCSDGQVQSHLNEMYRAIDPFGNDLIVLS